MLYFLTAYAASLPLAFIAGGAFDSSPELVAWLKALALAAFSWHALSWHRTPPGSAASTWSVAAVIGATWAALAMAWLYLRITMMPFSLKIAVESPADSYQTVVHVIGGAGFALGVAGVALCAALLVAGAWRLLRLARRLAWPLHPLAAAACLGALALLAAGDARYAFQELVLKPYLLDPDIEYAHYLVRPPSYAGLPVSSRESVFILQLESVNADAAFRRGARGSLERRFPQPGLEAILREGGGTLFPFFHANAMQTHRAQESILCAVNGNAGEPLSRAPDIGQRYTCLPRHLADAGFKTVFLYSYFDLSFFNFDTFQKGLGYQEVVYGPELMAPNDRRHVWGYDDCVFYGRAFDWLAKSGLARRERLFAYFEVSTNHFPFSGNLYPEAHPFPRPASWLQRYQNSLAEQDHCLSAFWRRFRELGRDDVHLFIVPDHSVIVAGVDEPRDNMFRTWLAYVPPARRRAQFPAREIFDPMPSHAQLYATILELLGAPRTPQSFAFALRNEPRSAGYDDCHMLTTPFDRVFTVRGGQMSEYNLRKEELRLADGSGQPLDFWVYRARHGCHLKQEK